MLDEEGAGEAHRLRHRRARARRRPRDPRLARAHAARAGRGQGARARRRTSSRSPCCSWRRGAASLRSAARRPTSATTAMRNPHPKPSDYDPRLIPLDDVIVRAMKLDPKERQQDAADVARALRAFLQGTDLADIARELGDRVRDLREAASEPMPMSLDGTRAPNPSIGDLGTKTFAARDEAIRWSRPPAARDRGASRRQHAKAAREHAGSRRGARAGRLARRDSRVAHEEHAARGDARSRSPRSPRARPGRRTLRCRSPRRS